MTIDVTDLAWMAGIVDVRGRVVKKTNPTRKNSSQVTLYVESTSTHVVERLCTMTGTTIEKKNRAGKPETIGGWYRKQCDEHCPDQHVHVSPFEAMTSARWTVSGAGLIIVGEQILPYLVNPDVVREGVTYARQHLTLFGRGAAATVTALRRLDALGWKTPEDIVERNREMFPWQNGNRLASYT